MIGLHHSGMHDFVMRELEVGARVAAYEDDEACGFGALFDVHYERYLATLSTATARTLCDDELWRWP